MILPRRSESRLISCEVCQRYLLEQRESALRLCVREKWLTAHKGEDRGSRMCHYRLQHWAPYLAAFVCKGPAIALTHASTFFTRWSSSAIKRLLLKASVAIDASKFKAVNNRVKSFTSARKSRGTVSHWKESISRYLSQLGAMDVEDSSTRAIPWSCVSWTNWMSARRSWRESFFSFVQAPAGLMPYRRAIFEALVSIHKQKLTRRYVPYELSSVSVGVPGFP